MPRPETLARPERWTGTDDGFYRVPDPLPPGEPGDLVRVQDLPAPAGTVARRIMYHSRDARDRDRAVTGVVTHPRGPAPAGGRPVVSWGHGTTGLAAAHAPSRLGLAPLGFGVDGVAVASDYVGRGPEGEVHPYLSKFGEGNAMVDAVRAVRQLPDAHAGRRWLAAGHSQGGHAALAAAERWADHAPELELLGTVAFAPGSDFERTFGPIDEYVARVVGAMMLYGAEGEHPEIDPGRYAGPELAAVADLIRTAPLDEIIPAVALLPAAGFYAHDPLRTEPARSLLLANEVGTVRVDAPALLLAGTADYRVAPDRVRALHDRMVALGQDVELVVVEGAGHDDLVDRTADRVAAWLAARLAD
jgi:pimeloyl-ACP methyl ester carboxylesterase